MNWEILKDRLCSTPDGQRAWHVESMHFWRCNYLSIEVPDDDNVRLMMNAFRKFPRTHGRAWQKKHRRAYLAAVAEMRRGTAK